MDPSTLKQIDLDTLDIGVEETKKGDETDIGSDISSISSSQVEGEAIVDEDDIDDDDDNDDVDNDDDDDEATDDDIDDDMDDEAEEVKSEDEESDQESEEKESKTPKKVVQHLESILASQPSIEPNDDDFEEDSDDEDYMEKFDENIKTDVIRKYHPDLMQSNYDEISALVKVVRDEQGNIIDPIHNTIPILTKFERARVLGLRAKQINNGADPFVEVPTNIIEGHIIAQMELEQRVLPFIIVRPLPNGKKEYWRIQDLKLIDY